MFQLPVRKRAIPVLASVLVLLVTAPTLAQGNAAIRLEPSSIVLRPDEMGEIEIRVENVTNLAGAEVHLRFDPTLVEIADADPQTEGVQVAHGGFLPADFVAVNRVDPAGGTIDYAVALMPPHQPVTGSGRLLAITLRGVAPGETTLAIQEVLLADRDGYPILLAADPTPAVVTISPHPLLPAFCWPWGVLILAALAFLTIRQR